MVKWATYLIVVHQILFIVRGMVGEQKDVCPPPYMARWEKLELKFIGVHDVHSFQSTQSSRS